MWGDCCGAFLCIFGYIYNDFECVGELKVLFWGCGVSGELLGTWELCFGVIFSGEVRGLAWLVLRGDILYCR